MGPANGFPIGGEGCFVLLVIHTAFRERAEEDPISRNSPPRVCCLRKTLWTCGQSSSAGMDVVTCMGQNSSEFASSGSSEELYNRTWCIIRDVIAQLAPKRIQKIQAGFLSERQRILFSASLDSQGQSKRAPWAVARRLVMAMHTYMIK